MLGASHSRVRELTTRLVDIATVLQEKDNWEKRLAGLQALRSIIEPPSDAPGLDGFLQAFSQHIKNPLQAQVIDLRSTISREACACVKALSQTPVAEAVSDWYIKDLFNNSCATVAAIASAADETLKEVASSGRVNRAAIQAFMASCTSKHATIRKNAYYCLLLLLTSVDHQALIKFDTTIENLLRVGVVDAVQDARKYARMALWAYEKVSQKGAQRTVDALESAVRRAVDGERPFYESWVESHTASSAPLSDPVRRPARALSVDRGSAPRKRSAASREKDQSGSTAPQPPTGYAARRVSQGPPPVDPPSSQPISATNRPVPAPSSPIAPPLAPDAWMTALESTRESDWLTRLRAFETIAAIVEHESLSLSRTAECIPVILAHLTDTHYRVAASVMQAFHVVTLKYPDVVAPYLERFFVPILQRLSDPKKPLADRAKVLLEILQKTYGVDLLFPVLHRVLDHTNAKVRVACIEFMLFIIDTDAHYFTSATALRATMHRLIHIAARKPPLEVHRATMSALARLYDQYREGFVAQMCSMSPSEQSDAIEVLRKTIPQIAQDCRRLQSGDGTLLRHPPASSSTPHSPRSHSGPLFNVAPTPQKSDRGPSRPSPASDTRRKAGTPVKGATPVQHRDPTAPTLDSTTIISASPVAQWRAEKAMPAEIAAFRAASTSDERRAALQGAQASLRDNVDVWLDHFNRLISFALSYVSDPADHNVRINALRLIRAIVTVDALHERASDQHEPMMRAAISCLDDPFPEVQSEAMTCFRGVVDAFDAALVLRSMLNVTEALLPLNARCLEFLLRELVHPLQPKHRATGIGGHYVEPAIVALIPRIVEVLTAAFAHHSSDIRKTAVLDFVDLYVALGDALLPRLAQLNHSQLKLISIYIVRAGVSPEPVDLVSKMVDAGIIAPRY